MSSVLNVKLAVSLLNMEGLGKWLRGKLGPDEEMGQRRATELAAYCGVSDSAVSQWLNKEHTELKGANLLRVATFFGVDASEVPQIARNKAPTTGSIRVVKRRTEQDTFLIPQYQAEGSMGRGLLLPGSTGVIKSWSVTREWVQNNVPHHTAPENLCIVTGFGPSMKGTFNSGDPLLLDRGITQVDVDAPYFFRIGEEGFIKFLQRLPQTNGERRLLAISTNQTFRPFEILPQSMDFEVFGQIIKIWQGENQ